VEEGEVMAPKIKRMSKKEFDKVANRSWVPVMLSGEGRPNWIRGIPDDKVEFILASGTYIDPRLVELNGITYSGAVGGMDVYRYDENDVSIGYPINKDHYILVLDPKEDNALLVHGPLKDHEHWISQLPELPDGIEIIEDSEE
jgi:hypothetical protein